jgi:hypothetical protein
MSTLARTRIRIAGDAACFDAPLDVNRHATPQFWRGNDVQFEIGVFFAGALMDVSNLASLTVEIRAIVDGAAPDPSTTPLMGATVSSFDNTTTLTTWQSGANQHAVVAFTAAQSNIVAGPAWLSIFVITNDDPGHVITLCAGPIGVREDGSGLATTPEPATETYYTAAQSDARFEPLSSGADILAAINGGTGFGSYTTGDLLYASGSSALAKLGIGSSGQVLCVVSGLPSWAAPTGGGGSWGSITGTLSSQSDLNSALAAKAPLASPTFTGTVSAPTVGTASDSSTKVATTAFVQSAIGAAAIGQSQITGLSSALALLAPLASPTFTGTPAAPTVSSASDSSTKLATTAFVQAAIAAGTTPGVWGSITGTLSSQSDLNTALAAKAPLASPTFTGTVSAPTPTSGDNTTKVATTAFVQAAISSTLGFASSGAEFLFETTAAAGGSPEDGNVIAIWGSNAVSNSAMRFLEYSAKGEMGAVGYENTGITGGYISGCVFLHSSPAYDYSTGSPNTSLYVPIDIRQEESNGASITLGTQGQTSGAHGGITINGGGVGLITLLNSSFSTSGGQYNFLNSSSSTGMVIINGTYGQNGGLELQGCDDNNAIALRNVAGSATGEMYFYSYGNNLSSLGAYRFYSNGYRSSQTLQAVFANDLNYFNQPILLGTTAQISGAQLTVNGGNISVASIGNTLQVKSGTNAKAGTFTLASGAATVANTSITANSVVVCTVKTSSGTLGLGSPEIVITAGTGFTATGASTDNSTYNFIVLEVN